jgi:hypothetical protein
MDRRKERKGERNGMKEEGERQERKTEERKEGWERGRVGGEEGGAREEKGGEGRKRKERKDCPVVLALVPHHIPQTSSKASAPHVSTAHKEPPSPHTSQAT